MPRPARPAPRARHDAIVRAFAAASHGGARLIGVDLGTKTIGLALVSAVIPFMTIWFEKRAERAGELDTPAAGPRVTA
mgnify:CR=1 FL=1